MLLISINPLNIKYLGDSLIYIVLTNGLLVCITQIVNLIVSIIIKNKRNNNNRNTKYKVSAFRSQKLDRTRDGSGNSTMLKVVNQSNEIDNQSIDNSISHNFGKSKIKFETFRIFKL